LFSDLTLEKVLDHTTSFRIKLPICHGPKESLVPCSKGINFTVFNSDFLYVKCLIFGVLSITFFWTSRTTSNDQMYLCYLPRFSSCARQLLCFPVLFFLFLSDPHHKFTTHTHPNPLTCLGGAEAVDLRSVFFFYVSSPCPPNLFSISQLDGSVVFLPGMSVPSTRALLPGRCLPLDVLPPCDYPAMSIHLL
jgi:hypothetical protein